DLQRPSLQREDPSRQEPGVAIEETVWLVRAGIDVASPVTDHERAAVQDADRVSGHRNLPLGLAYSPYSSSSRSHTSLTVGNEGTACHSRSRGTSATMAMVAECNSSWTSGPVKVAPTTTLRDS